MDIKLAQELIRTQSLESVNAYLASSTFDEDVSKMSFSGIMRYMMTQPVIPQRDEYQVAMAVLSYNASAGKLKHLDCPFCKNKGTTMRLDDNGVQVVSECSCMVKRRCISNAQNSGMGALLECTFDNFQCAARWRKSILSSVKSYVEQHKANWLAMLGQSGSGKTHLCSAVANTFLSQGFQVVYMQWVVDVKELKRFAMDDTEYARLFYKYAYAQVLYIDDLFKGKYTEADVTIAFEIINYRDNQGKLTIISSEKYIDELLDIDVALAGRIKKRCDNFVINISRDESRNYRLWGDADDR